jgi:hypothetical protein
MKLTDKIKQVETVKIVSEDEIRKFFESLDYDKAIVDTDRLRVKIKFNDGVIKIKNYPFPTEEQRKHIFEVMGISDLITGYHRSLTAEYFTIFEFVVEKNKLANWYK